LDRSPEVIRLAPLLRIDTTVKLLGSLEKPFYTAVNPLVQRLIRTGVRPNTITTIGTGLVLVSAVVYATGHIRLGGLLLLLSGVADTLDGQVARGGAMVTRFGAFYDSTLDRVGDGATFIGIGAFLLTAPDVAYRVPAVILCMVAILGSVLVSYARARAEGLGLDCKVGIAQRAERILGLGVASVLFGAGPRALLLEGIVALLAVASLITVVQRFVYVHRHAGQVDQALRIEEVKQSAEVKRSADLKHASLDSLAKGP
jgi:phosphatidylinositol phosphate synthase